MPDELPETPAPAGDAPWSTDLSALGLDESQAAAVDGYLREKWQPRMTQYEQQVAKLAPAAELWQDFQADPQGTYAAVGEQLFGDEFAQNLNGLWQPADETEETPAAVEPAPIDPRVQALIDAEEARQQRAAYEARLAEVREQHQDVEPELIAPFVVAAEGDWNMAVQAYQHWMGQARERFGLTVPEEVLPPTAVGTSAAQGGTTPPPVQQQFGSLDDALDSAMDDMRAARAPSTVGTI